MLDYVRFSTMLGSALVKLFFSYREGTGNDRHAQEGLAIPDLSSHKQPRTVPIFFFFLVFTPSWELLLLAITPTYVRRCAILIGIHCSLGVRPLLLERNYINKLKCLSGLEPTAFTLTIYKLRII